MKRFFYPLFVVLLVAALGVAAWAWITLHFSYSTGERAGYVQKISHKGWICKTWEGELAMANLPGAMPKIFQFSVRDEQVAKQITQYAGQQVSLTYEEHKGVPTSCFGETGYYVVKLTPIKLMTPATPPAPAPAAHPAPVTPSTSR